MVWFFPITKILDGSPTLTAGWTRERIRYMFFLYLRLANCLFVFILLCTGRLYYSILCPRHLKHKTSGSISEIPTKIVGSTKTNLQLSSVTLSQETILIFIFNSNPWSTFRGCLRSLFLKCWIFEDTTARNSFPPPN